LPVPADVEQVALGANGLIEGMRPDTAFFDMSTNSVAMVRKINAAFAEKNLYMLDSRVSGGPSGAASGKIAIWAGGEAVRQGQRAGSAPLTGSDGFCRVSTTRPISLCGCCIRMSGLRSGSGARSGCRCDSPTWPLRN
jgi:hypothetical protein